MATPSDPTDPTPPPSTQSQGHRPAPRLTPEVVAMLVLLSHISPNASEDRMEAVQEAWLSYLTHLDRNPDVTDPATIVRQFRGQLWWRMRDQHRQRGLRPDGGAALDGIPEPEPNSNRETDVQWLLEAIERLPPVDRRIVEAVYFEGKSMTEVGRELFAMGRASSNCRRVGSRLERILRELRGLKPPEE